MTDHAKDYAVDPEAGVHLFHQRPNRSRCTIAGPDGIVIVSPCKAPNRFWRVMQRWCLGIVWEVLDDE